MWPRPQCRRKGCPQQAVPLRRSREDIDALVSDILARSNAPISAYDIAHRSVSAGTPLVPNQVYRTLARLMEQGLVLRLESLAAYMLKAERFDCCLICDQCHAVQLLSTPELAMRLRACAQAHGFTVSQTIIETHGRCADCASAPRRTDDRNAVPSFPTPPGGV
ncbi:Fur family transcriptional regulator [Sphingomonas sp. CJ20]